MAHYATLSEYRFDADVDDIRGATLYGQGDDKIAKIDDVVFNHQNGEIQYLVAKADHGRRVLIPLNHVFVSTTDEQSFSSDLTRAEIDGLPEFDDSSLKDDDRWKESRKRHEDYWEQREKAATKEFKEEYDEGPVTHRKDDPSRIITTRDVNVPMGSSTSSGFSERQSDDYVPDVQPERIAPVFGGTANTSDKVNMQPNTDTLRDTRTGYDPNRLGRRYSNFAGTMRRDIGRIRTGCGVCDTDRKVA